MSKVEEQYAKAVRSSHLEQTRATEDGDLDLVIAAGMADTLGALLARLKGEWDGKKGVLMLYRREQNRLHREADELLRDAETLRRDMNPKTQPGSLVEANSKTEAARLIREAAEREAVSGRMHILLEMGSLGPAKQALYNLAMRQAGKKACTSPEESLAALVGRVLDVWLDRLCAPCNGRGFTGGYGSPKVICQTKPSGCGGSGSRRTAPLSKDPAEQAFGLWLLNVMDTKAAEALKTIGRKTR